MRGRSFSCAVEFASDFGFFGGRCLHMHAAQISDKTGAFGRRLATTFPRGHAAVLRDYHKANPP